MINEQANVGLSANELNILCSNYGCSANMAIEMAQSYTSFASIS